MRHLLAVVLFGAATVLALEAATTGLLYPRAMAQPVSVRQGSADLRTGLFAYFATGRRHTGGGYRGGK